jgi:hypothetical protein
MLHGPPLPLSTRHSLSELLAHARPSEALGAWVRGCSRGQHIVRIGCAAACRVLASPDLGFLLNRCDRILVRDGELPVVVGAETLIAWRSLQVATATPYLHGLERLRMLFPDFECNDKALLVPLGVRRPEEVLASCLAEGIQVTGSRVVYSAATRPRAQRP